MTRKKLEEGRMGGAFCLLIQRYNTTRFTFPRYIIQIINNLFPVEIREKCSLIFSRDHFFRSILGRIANDRGAGRGKWIGKRKRVAGLAKFFRPGRKIEKQSEENLRGFWTCTGDGGLVRVTTTGGGILACNAARHEFATS